LRSTTARSASVSVPVSLVGSMVEAEEMQAHAYIALAPVWITKIDVTVSATNANAAILHGLKALSIFPLRRTTKKKESNPTQGPKASIALQLSFLSFPLPHHPPYTSLCPEDCNVACMRTSSLKVRTHSHPLRPCLPRRLSFFFSASLDLSESVRSLITFDLPSNLTSRPLSFVNPTPTI